MESVNPPSITKSNKDTLTNQEKLSAISRDGDKSRTLIEDVKETKEAEKSGECELSRYIKKGECKDSFIELSKCVGEAKKSKEECKEVRLMFKTCMYDNPSYYEPILAAEAKVNARALSELEMGKQDGSDGSNKNE